MNRMRKTLALWSTGGVVFGVVQAFDMVSFAEVLTRFLATVLSFLVSLLLGGDPNSLNFGNSVSL
jgi:hypothetical protein